jgi:hypothetical protein
MRTKRALAGMFAPSMVRPATRWSVSDRLVSHPAAAALFDRHRPALYVASSPGLIFSELPLLRTAAQRGVRSMAVDPSWDNFTNKLLPVRRVDRLVVWNDVMRDQAIEFHGYQPEEIRVVRRVFVDAASGLVVKTDSTRKVRGHDTPFEVVYGDYRETGGVRFARSIEIGVRDRPQRLRIILENVELNPALDDSRFAAPR